MARQARTRQEVKEELKKLILSTGVIVLCITLFFNIQVKTMKIAIEDPTVNTENKKEEKKTTLKEPKYASK